MPRLLTLILLLLPTLLRASPPPTTAPTLPYILHLPGIGGPLPLDTAFCQGLTSSHLPTPEIYDWTCHDPGLHALTAYDRNRQQSQVVAQKLLAQYRAHPHTPILLTAHSGGTGIAVWALELLPPDVHIQTLLLMQSALSPNYDLSPALTHVTGKAYALSSLHDNIVLGTGTSTLGTIDRVFTQAAGMVGFIPPAHPQFPSQYAKLNSMPYNDLWLKLGNIGDHIGPMRRLFSSQILSPLLGGTPPVPPSTRPIMTPR